MHASPSDWQSLSRRRSLAGADEASAQYLKANEWSDALPPFGGIVASPNLQLHQWLPISDGQVELPQRGERVAAFVGLTERGQ